MSSITFVPKFKPVKCQFCGAEYEFEISDRVDSENKIFATSTGGGRSIADGKYYGKKTLLFLKCPICGEANRLEKEYENE